jgi:uncharacterized protein YidB (DUF937 family)
MGLLDGLLGGLMGGGMSDPRQRSGGIGGMGGMGTAAIIAIVLQLLQRNGGLGGLLQRMQQAGAGPQGHSWVGTGQNMPISPDMLSQIFGSGQIDEIAQQLGVSRGEAETTVAQALPDVVDRMTPGGSIPDDSDDLVSRTLQELANRR